MDIKDIDYNKDYYSILGVDKNANADAIKKAYRKASLKWHPDRNPGDKNAEEKFKEVNDAYSILSDENLKQAYDNGPEMMSDFGMFNSMRDMFRHHTEQVQPTILELKVTYDEICHGLKDHPIKYYREVHCDKCHGTGGTGVESCKTCGGRGFIINMSRDINSVVQQMTVCPDCHGAGKTVKEKCDKCHGTGLKTEYATFNFTAAPIDLALDNSNLYVGKFGNMAKDTKEAAPLIIHIQHNLPKGMTIRNRPFAEKFDIQHMMEIPYYDMLLGTKVNVKTPSGKTIAITIPEGCQNGKVLVAKGQGFFGGDYMVIPVIKTDKITKEEKECLEKIKKMHE